MRKLLSIFFFSSCVVTNAQKKSDPNQPAGYWQQEVNYEIEVTLDDKNHALIGFEKITYINHSPHQLSYLWFHLWPNAYKNEKTALANQLFENGELDFYFDPDSEKGYIDSLCFVSGTDTLEWKFKGDSIDIAKITLKNVLHAHDTIVITTPFYVKIPSGNYSRLGHIGQSYQITQWYPKPAVYDKDGWHEMPYLNQGEFYSEYGAFDVKIKLPENYFVGHTGDLVNGEEENARIKKRVQETEKLIGQNINKVGNIIEPQENKSPASSTTFKTLQIHQEKVHDFAWFADKRYYILEGSVELPDSKRKVKTFAYFTAQNSRYWSKSIEYLNQSTFYYSLWNGDYPYNHVTAVDGTISAGGGMEYPNVTVIGDVGSDMSLETVIMHEVGHNWFYGILGTNERDHAWMDEGINSFNEMRYLKTLHPEQNLINSFAGNLSPKFLQRFGLDHLKSRHQYYLAYLYSARKNKDQPIEEKSYNFTSTNYGTIVYSKTAQAFDYLQDYLGTAVFDTAMHRYYKKWKFKHPQPDDLQFVFEQVSKQDLNWFFKDLLGTNKVVDYQIVRKRRVNPASSVTYGWMKYDEQIIIHNRGDINAPFSITGIDKYDSVLYHKWYQGIGDEFDVTFPNCQCEKFVIDYYEHSTDYRRSNNTLYERKLGKRWEKPKLQFIGSIEDISRSLINFVPAVGYNSYDGFMLGAAFYNAVFPSNNFEYAIMPMYSIRNNRARGMATVSYRFHGRQSTLFHSIKPGLHFSSFGISTADANDWNAYSYYTKLQPFLEVNFKKKEARSIHQHSILYRYVFIEEKSASFCNTCDSVDAMYINDLELHELKYTYKNSHSIHPWQANFTSRYSKDFSVLMGEANYKHILNRNGMAVQMRFFGGFFIQSNTSNPKYSFRMDGQSGQHDYLYDEIFPGRFEERGNDNEKGGILPQQFMESYGAFKVPTGWGQSSKWLFALNIKMNTFIFPFVDIGISDFMPSDEAILYDAGLGLKLIKDYVVVYFPLVYNQSIKDELEANVRSFKHTIRFTFNLTQANPLKLVRDL